MQLLLPGVQEVILTVAEDKAGHCLPREQGSVGHRSRPLPSLVIVELLWCQEVLFVWVPDDTEALPGEDRIGVFCSTPGPRPLRWQWSSSGSIHTRPQALSPWLHW